MSRKDINDYMKLSYEIVIREDPHGGFFAKVEELEGCMTQGETYDETSRNIVEAMELWLEASIEMAMEIPEPEPAFKLAPL
ncbi:MAG: type II toxin-antitoxin system HicB family antitoxin [Candidatus Aminicenantes bacterium]|nr:type II toxin-antitoxin system HicB family antitoxin [Candidatus Aminicenantes bacterium]